MFKKQINIGQENNNFRRRTLKEEPKIDKKSILSVTLISRLTSTYENRCNIRQMIFASNDQSRVTTMAL